MKKKVLFVISTLNLGGAENSLVKVLNYIKDDYDIDVLLLRREGYWLGKIPSNINVIHLYDPKKEWKKNKFLNILRILKAVMQRCFLLISRYTNFGYRISRFLKLKKHYDVEVAYLSPNPVQFVATAPKNTIKIHAVRNSIINSVRLSMPRWYLKRCEVSYKKMDRFYCVSGDATNELIEMYPFTKDKAVTIDNMFEFNELKKKAKEKIDFKFDSKKVNVVTVGRVAPQKDYLKLLEAHKKLIEDGVEHILHIIGRYKTEKGTFYADGKLIFDYIKNNKLDSTVILHGETRNPYPYMKQADVYVSSSLFEGYPRTVAEALILGAPIVATNVSGTAYTLKYGELGMLVDDSVDGLYNGLKEVIINEKTREDYKNKTKKFKDKKYEIIDEIKDIIEQ